MIKFPISRFQVYDRSMEPAFGEYDRVLTYNLGPVELGSVIVFRDADKLLIKRIKSIKGENIVAVSDNKKLAKKEYKIAKKDIIGRVFLKY